MKSESEDLSEGLIGPNQRRQMRLAESLTKAFAPKVKVSLRGEQLIIEIDGKAVWLDHDFRIVGEAVTPA